MTNKEEGEKLIIEAGKILERDLKGALEAKDYNLTVRRSQEVVELSLKGALKILGVDYPKVHDVGPVFAEQAKKKTSKATEETIKKITEISAWLGETRAPAFYFEKDYNEEDAEKAFEDAAFVFAEIKKLFK